MSKQSSRIRKNEELTVYDYDKEIQRIYLKIDSQLSKRTAKLIRTYDQVMINIPLAKATRRKHLQTVFGLSRFLNKDWHIVKRVDIDSLVSRIMTEYADVNGQESNSSYDSKKILKIFFRWFKLGSRDFSEVGDPVETKHVKLRKVKDKIERESLIDEKDITNLLAVCDDSLRNKAFIDVHSEAGTRPTEILSLKIKNVNGIDVTGADFDLVGLNVVRGSGSTTDPNPSPNCDPTTENTVTHGGVTTCIAKGKTTGDSNQNQMCIIGEVGCEICIDDISNGGFPCTENYRSSYCNDSTNCGTPSGNDENGADINIPKITSVDDNDCNDSGLVSLDVSNTCLVVGPTTTTTSGEDGIDIGEIQTDYSMMIVAGVGIFVLTLIIVLVVVKRNQN